MPKIIIGTDKYHGTDLSIQNQDLLVELFKKDCDFYFDNLGAEMISDFDIKYAPGDEYAVADMGGALIVDGEFFALKMYDSTRADPFFVKLLEEYGIEKVMTKFGKNHLKIVDIPDDVNWHIAYPDLGPMWVGEDARTWS